MRTVSSLFPRGDHLEEDEESEESRLPVSFGTHYSCTTACRPRGGALSVFYCVTKRKKLGSDWTRVLCLFKVENSSRILSQSP